MTTKNPTIHITKNLDVSTAHITKDDADLLTSQVYKGNFEVEDVIVYPYQEGFFVYVPREDTRTFNRRARKAGFSESFLKVINLARKNGCKYAQLDCDGPLYKGLKRHEW
jgi:hypothetical protein